MLAVVITAKDIENAVADIKKADGADLIELRLDYLREMELSKLNRLVKHCKKPIIVTNRRTAEGGFFNGDEDERIQLLAKALESGADYIDIEYSSDKKQLKNLIKNRQYTKMIVSYHNLKETPNNVSAIYKNIKKLNPDIIKIVAKANSVTDNFKIFGLIKAANMENRKIISFCMGSYGQSSRILGVILGSRITYSSIEEGKGSADGQLTLKEIIGDYRIKRVGKNTKIFGLIGNPVEHSWSHIIHNTAFEKMNINSVYLKFKVDKLKEFIEYFKKLNIGGFSVTIPHKVEAMKYIDSVDKKAKEIGAINTIVARKGRLIGFNTDCDGAMQALKKVMKIRDKKIFVLGTGGAARAIIYGLKENGANPVVLSRKMEKAAKFGKDLDVDYDVIENLSLYECDALINATPVGMYPNVNQSSIPSNLVPSGSVVMDAVFNPLKTKLIREAEKKKCVTIPGIEMFINQAALQFRLWTGKDAPENIMREKILDQFSKC